jgi:hypothetical protein
MTPGKPAPSSQWRLIACDLDGTLIGWNHKTNERDLASPSRSAPAATRSNAAASSAHSTCPSRWAWVSLPTEH